MIGKESIARNDRSGITGDTLEKLLDFSCKLQGRTGKRGRRRASPGAQQAALDLNHRPFRT
jgi:hypothetical protein